VKALGPGHPFRTLQRKSSLGRFPASASFTDGGKRLLVLDKNVLLFQYAKANDSLVSKFTLSKMHLVSNAACRH
jgi:hypothetical protein